MDALINYKASIAEKYGIRILLDAIVPYDTVFEDTALYSLLGNLLDNAIEAVIKYSIGGKNYQNADTYYK